MKKPELNDLIELVDDSAVVPACIQNGNGGSGFKDSYNEQMEQVKEVTEQILNQ